MKMGGRAGGRAIPWGIGVLCFPCLCPSRIQWIPQTGSEVALTRKIFVPAKMFGMNMKEQLLILINSLCGGSTATQSGPRVSRTL